MLLLQLLSVSTKIYLHGSHVKVERINERYQIIEEYRSSHRQGRSHIRTHVDTSVAVAILHVAFDSVAVTWAHMEIAGLT
jgi:hypothetical protein